MARRLRSSDVFINCPFDVAYQPIFNAIVFGIFDLGLKARCALEESDSGEVRLSKIERILEECRFGIHDLSAVELDANTKLPRFNMPLELGLFLGCKRFGPANQSKKRTLILESQRYRYQTFISDIAGQDIRAHRGDPECAIREVRDWLQTASRSARLASGAEIVIHFRKFQADLPAICTETGLEPDKLTFIDLCALTTEWLRTNR